MVFSFRYYEVRIPAPTGAKPATVMGLAISQALRLQADEVIE